MIDDLRLTIDDLKNLSGRGLHLYVDVCFQSSIVNRKSSISTRGLHEPER
jgi:hypothetical protein